MSVPMRAILVSQYSHIVSVRLRISEPRARVQVVNADGKLGTQWADAGLEIMLQDTRGETATPLVFLAAAGLYPGGAHAMALHMETMLTSIRWLGQGLDSWCHARNIAGPDLDKMPARGSVEAEIITQVPRGAGLRTRGGITLRVNNEQAPVDIPAAIAATNPAMVAQLIRALTDLRDKGVAASKATANMPPAKS